MSTQLEHPVSARDTKRAGDAKASAAAVGTTGNTAVAASFRGFIETLIQLVSDVGDDVAEEARSAVPGGVAPHEAALLARGGDALRALVAVDDWLPDAYAQPSLERYQQFLLYRDPLDRFSVVSFVWGPGQRTPIHDHTVWGLIGMLRGAEVSSAYARTTSGTVVATGEDTVLRVGMVEAVSPTVGDIHRVVNLHDDAVSISIHVYGADIGKVARWVYPEDGAAPKGFISGYSNGALPPLLAAL